MAIGITEIIVILTCIISWQGMNNQNFQNQCLFIPYEVKNSNEYYRVLSHMLIHADIAHLAFNMISLYYLGGYLEMELTYEFGNLCLLYTSPSPRDRQKSRMPSSA